MYYEARTDAKLRVLSDRQFRIWFNLLCFGAEHDPQNATISIKSEELLAVEVADGDIESLRETISRLAALDILAVDGNQLRFTHFRERQYDYPSDEPEAVNERVKRHRNAKKHDTNDVKRDVTSCNDTEEKQKRTDPEPETERARVTHVTRGAASAPAATLPAVGTSAVERRMWAVMRDELGYEPHQENRNERGEWNKAIKQLLALGENPDSVKGLIDRYRERWPGIDCTPSALWNKQALIRSPLPAKNGNGHATDAPTEADIHARNAEILRLSREIPEAYRKPPNGASPSLRSERTHDERRSEP